MCLFECVYPTADQNVFLEFESVQALTYVTETGATYKTHHEIAVKLYDPQSHNTAQLN